MILKNLVLLIIIALPINTYSQMAFYRFYRCANSDIYASCWKLDGNSDWTNWREIGKEQNVPTIGDVSTFRIYKEDVYYPYNFYDNLYTAKRNLRISGTLTSLQSKKAEESIANFKNQNKNNRLVYCELPSFLEDFSPAFWCNRQRRFSITTDNWSFPSSKDVQEAIEKDGWFHYTGTFRYYINNEYPTLKDQIIKYGYPCVGHWEGTEKIEKVKISIGALFFERFQYYLTLNIHFENGFSYAFQFAAINSVSNWNDQGKEVAFCINGGMFDYYQLVKYIMKNY